MSPLWGEESAEMPLRCFDGNLNTGGPMPPVADSKPPYLTVSYLLLVSGTLLMGDVFGRAYQDHIIIIIIIIIVTN